MDAENRRATDRLAVGVIAAAALAALALGQRYWPVHAELWTDVVHDRNAHLDLGLGLASDLVHGRIREVVRDIDRARTWPPLHDGALVAGSVAVAGLDVRAAVLPSLIGYAAAVVLAFLTARRLAGSAAGVVAAALTLASPALRAFATDVMLESPGACLTLAALYASVRVRQDNRPADWRWLAAALSGLFFLKYNYWLLVVLALVGDAAARNGCRWLAAVPALRGLNGAWVVRQCGHPLNWFGLALLAACAWVRLTGGGEVRLFGQTVVIRSNLNLATFAYWVLLARLWPWYWRVARPWVVRVARRSAIVNGHVLPVAVWLAWPQKLACCLWVLNPADNVGEFPAAGAWSGLCFYLNALAADYHSGAWALGGVLILAALGIVAGVRGRLQAGWTAVVVLLLLATVLTVRHPNRKSRFLHSWWPAAWVLAGAGVAVLPRSRPGWRWAVAAGVAATQAPGLFMPPHAPEGGIQPDRPPAFAITDAYLPHLADAVRPAILSNVPLKFLARWTYLDRYGRGVRPVTEVAGLDPSRVSAENDEAVSRWLATTPCDVVVWIDIPAGSPWYVPVPGCAGLASVGPCIAGALPATHQHTLADGTRVTVYRCRHPGR